MNTYLTDHRAVIVAIENVLTEVWLLSAIAAVGIALTVLASGRPGWSIVAGIAALVMFLLAAWTYRAGRRTSAGDTHPKQAP